MGDLSSNPGTDFKIEVSIHDLDAGGRGTQGRGDRVNPRVVAQLVSSEFNKGPSLKNKLMSDKCSHTNTTARGPLSLLSQVSTQQVGQHPKHRGHLPHGNYQHQV